MIPKNRFEDKQENNQGVFVNALKQDNIIDNYAVHEEDANHLMADKNKKNGGDDLQKCNEDLKKSLLKMKSVTKGRKVKKLPDKKTLKSVYASKFSSKYNEEKRNSKIGNANSRLYIKDKNSKAVNEAANRFGSKKNELMVQAMGGRKYGCSIEDFHDLSVFMVENEEENARLLDNYIGTGKDLESGQMLGRDRREALDYMTKQFFALDISGIDFTTDSGIAENAFKLEAVVSYAGAFNRLLASNPEYLESLTEELQKAVTVRLEELTFAANYYLSRKELINDDYYRTHYDDELSMKIDEKTTDEQRAVAEKLLNSYVLGRNFIGLNSFAKNKAIPDLHFKNDMSRDLYQKALTLTDPDEQKQYLEKAYCHMDYLAGGIRLDANNIKLTGGERAKLMFLGGENCTDEYNIENLKQNEIDNNVRKKEALMNESNRPDIGEIRQKLTQAGIIGVGNLELKNPYMDYEIKGLNFSRILNSWSKWTTAFMGTNDIIEMMYKMAAPQLPENKNLDKNSAKVKKLNRDFKEGVEKFKEYLHITLKSFMNTFGALPSQLSFKDFLKVMYHYGDLFTVYSDCAQDITQLIGYDINGTFFDFKNNESDREIKYYRDYVNLIRHKYGRETNTYFAAGDGHEQTLASVYGGATWNDAEFYSGDMEKSKFMNGPSMSQRQQKLYENNLYGNLKTNVDLEEFNAYKERRKAFTDSYGNTLKMWSERALSRYEDEIRRNNDRVELGETRNRAINHYMSIEKLKASRFWKDPESAPTDAEKKAFRFAKDNEGRLMKIIVDIENKMKTLKEKKN